MIIGKMMTKCVWGYSTPPPSPILKNDDEKKIMMTEGGTPLSGQIFWWRHLWTAPKGCLKDLARAKNVMRAQKRKNAIFGAINFTPLQVPDHSVPVPNQACGGTQNSLNRNPLQYLTSKHDVYTSGTRKAELVDFLLQKFLHLLNNLFKYA